jgi:hypothetical protein
MALGAITMNTEEGGRPSAPLYMLDLSVVLDGAYPTGGTTGFSLLVAAAARAASPPLADTFAPADVFGIIALDGAGYTLAYNKTTDALKVYQCAGSAAPGAEVPNATNLSGVTVRVVVLHQ